MDARYLDRTPPPGWLHNRRSLSIVIRLTIGAVLAWSTASHAQSPPVPDAAPIELRGSASVPAYVEYDKKVRASEQLNPLAGELFGEDVSLYTGATEFSYVDIDIPGNNALPVQLRRRFTVSALVPDQAHDRSTDHAATMSNFFRVASFASASNAGCLSRPWRR